VENSDFLLICVYSLAIVFSLLAILSVLIRLLIIVFPEKSDDNNAAVVAAITTHLSTIYPNTKITKIEERK